MSWYPNFTEQLGRDRQARLTADAAAQRRRAGRNATNIRFRAGLAGRLRSLADRLDEPAA